MLFIPFFYMVMALNVFGFGLCPQTIIAAEGTVKVSEEDFQVLASGPIHGAFAEAMAFDPEPGIIVSKAPPAIIEEIPPDQKPEGNVQWIPGYWAWDDEREGYIWVSGIWRVSPPDRQWIPGYWTSAGRGYQWISGYWASVKTKEVEYLPEPPESVEVGPSSNAPSSDYIWMPGCWLWRYERYSWRPGYWAVVNPDWIWIPAHYIWTPRGYLFVGGYWDYIVIHRGVLFAPVFFPSRVHIGLAFSFSPGFVIDLNVFDDALFLRSRYYHYYYGDFYAPRYYRSGIYPWFSLHARRVAYDPIYAHQRWKHRNDHGWENSLHKKFRERREYKGLRSPRSFDYRTGHDKANRASESGLPNFVMPFDHVGKNKASVYRFKPLSEKERKKFLQQKKDVHIYQEKRQSREARQHNMLDKNVSKKPGPNKENFFRSPIIDKKTDRKKAPPARYKAPKLNSNVEPLRRKYNLPRSLEESHKSEKRGQKKEVGEKLSIDDVQKTEKKGRRSDDQKSNDWQQRLNKEHKEGYDKVRDRE